MTSRDALVFGAGSLLTALMIPTAVILHRATQRRLPVRTDFLARL